MPSSCSIRKVSEQDTPSLSRVCLLTSDVGKSGEHLHEHPELPGLLYAVPYVKLPFTFGFVIVTDDTQQVVGYVLGASDTRSFESAAREAWWPALQQRYPGEGPGKIRGTEADDRYARLIRSNMMSDAAAEEQCIQFSPAHLHIDMLAEYQRKGYGRKLIGRAVEYLRDELGLSGLWIGVDSRNEGAIKFYERLGFASIPGAAPHNMGLAFSNWNA